MPPLIKRTPIQLPVWTHELTHRAVVLTLSLIFLVTAGLATLDATSPKLSTAFQRNIATISDFSQLASVLETVKNPLDSFVTTFGNLNNLVLSKLFPPSSSQLVQVPQEVVSSTQFALTESFPSLDFSSLKSEIQAELESYVRSQISSLTEPLIVYQSGPTIDTLSINSGQATILREQILTDTRLREDAARFVVAEARIKKTIFSDCLFYF